MVKKGSREYWDALFAHNTKPWEGDGEDAVRWRQEEDRKASDDHEWVARRHERSGAYCE